MKQNIGQVIIFPYLEDKIFIIYLRIIYYTCEVNSRERKSYQRFAPQLYPRGSEGTANTLYKYRRERRAYLRDILLVAAVMCTNSATEIASVVTEKLRRPIIKVLHQRPVMLRSRARDRASAYIICVIAATRRSDTMSICRDDDAIKRVRRTRRSRSEA